MLRRRTLTLLPIDCAAAAAVLMAAATVGTLGWTLGSLLQTSTSNSSDDDGALLCRLTLYEMLQEVRDNPHFVVCEHEREEFLIENDTTLLEQFGFALESGETVDVKIWQAEMVRNDTLRWTGATRAKRHFNPGGDSEDGRGRRLARSTGRVTVLPIYITTPNFKPTYHADDWYTLLFEGDGSLLEQYHAVSQGRIQLQPMDVLKVKVEDNFYEKPQHMVHDAAAAALEKVLRHPHKYLGDDEERSDHRGNHDDDDDGYKGKSRDDESPPTVTFNSINEVADLVLFMTPRMPISWHAYAAVGKTRSVFHDSIGAYLTPLMHETGHSFSLGHANEDGREYQDYSNYMGGFDLQYHGIERGPRMTFHGQHYVQLGWTQPRRVPAPPSARSNIYDTTSTENNTETQLSFPPIPIVGIAVDESFSNDLPEEDSWRQARVVQWGDDYFIHYNLATGFNADVWEYPNEVLIIYHDNRTLGTELVAALKVGDVWDYPGVTTESSKEPRFQQLQVCASPDGDETVRWISWNGCRDGFGGDNIGNENEHTGFVASVGKKDPADFPLRHAKLFKENDDLRGHLHWRKRVRGR